MSKKEMKKQRKMNERMYQLRDYLQLNLDKVVEVAEFLNDYVHDYHNAGLLIDAAKCMADFANAFDKLIVEA